MRKPIIKTCISVPEGKNPNKNFKIEILIKKNKFWSRIKILVKNRNFGQKYKFWLKIKI